MRYLDHEEAMKQLMGIARSGREGIHDRVDAYKELAANQDCDAWIGREGAVTKIGEERITVALGGEGGSVSQDSEGNVKSEATTIEAAVARCRLEFRTEDPYEVPQAEGIRPVDDRKFVTYEQDEVVWRWSSRKAGKKVGSPK